MASTPLSTLPRAVEIRLVDTDEPFMIEVLAPIESETKDAAVEEAVEGAQSLIDSAIESLQDKLTVLTNFVMAIGESVSALQDAVEGKLTAADNLSDVDDPVASLAALNGLDRRILSLPGNPAPADIPSGTARIVKNASTNRLSLWANDGGTLVDLLTFTPAS